MSYLPMNGFNDLRDVGPGRPRGEVTGGAVELHEGIVCEDVPNVIGIIGRVHGGRSSVFLKSSRPYRGAPFAHRRDG